MSLGLTCLGGALGGTAASLYTSISNDALFIILSAVVFTIILILTVVIILKCKFCSGIVNRGDFRELEFCDFFKKAVGSLVNDRIAELNQIVSE